jgi:hypothetical protein
MYPVELEICIRPVFYLDPPEYCISVEDKTITGKLENITTFAFSIIADTKSFVSIQLLNKNNSDTIVNQNLDKAIVIEWIRFFGIQDPKFVWQGRYRPVYPEPWYSQQVTPPSVELSNICYLGWNGTWRLDFDVPIFTWIHQVQNHGWIYD